MSANVEGTEISEKHPAAVPNSTDIVHLNYNAGDFEEVSLGDPFDDRNQVYIANSSAVERAAPARKRRCIPGPIITWPLLLCYCFSFVAVLILWVILMVAMFQSGKLSGPSSRDVDAVVSRALNSTEKGVFGGVTALLSLELLFGVWISRTIARERRM